MVNPHLLGYIVKTTVIDLAAMQLSLAVLTLKPTFLLQ